MGTQCITSCFPRNTGTEWQVLYCLTVYALGFCKLVFDKGGKYSSVELKKTRAADIQRAKMIQIWLSLLFLLSQPDKIPPRLQKEITQFWKSWITNCPFWGWSFWTRLWVVVRSNTVGPRVTESRWVGGKTAVVQSEDNLIPVQCTGNPVQLWLRWLDPIVTPGGPSMALDHTHGPHAPFSLCLKCYVKRTMFVREN